MSVSRRDFLTSGASAAAGVALGTPLLAQPGQDRLAGSTFARPVVIASSNGLRGVKKAYDMIADGADPLDAIVAGVNVVELNPADQSVGLGGLPNADGVVQLDASCMHGPTRRAGAVACLEGIATPSLVAKAVMDNTDHILLVGDDAKRFALQMGFEERDLLTEASRRRWLEWKRSPGAANYWVDTRPPGRDARDGETRGARRPAPSFQHEHLYDETGALAYTTGTINMNAVTASGDVASVTTTSGMSWKIPGRVGDSPILGAGQYCDNTVGAAGSTGRGEANIKVCGAFLAVELMRQGMEPETALMKVME